MKPRSNLERSQAALQRLSEVNAKNTPARREQWKQFNALGQTVSLASWIRSKRADVESLKTQSVSRVTTVRALTLMALTADCLEELARDAGWDPAKPTAGKRLYK